jgi:hypothetical protein
MRFGKDLGRLTELVRQVWADRSSNVSPGNNDLPVLVLDGQLENT